MKKPRLLVITPVKHINGVSDKLESFSDVCYIDDPSLDDILPLIDDFDAIFTNPNKSKIFIGNRLLDLAKNLKVICTASTGTNHIDMNYAKLKDICVLSLTEERKIINKISSTAEHAFALTLSSLRNITNSYNDVLEGGWDYEKFIGRQMDGLIIGIIGFGRLGNLYSGYCKAFGSEVLAYDPYKKILKDGVKQVRNIEQIFSKSDIISIHVHVTDETKNMIDKHYFDQMKRTTLIINTSRGEIINEADLVNYLTKNPLAKVATDVLADEIVDRKNSFLFKYSLISDQVIITPHIGGMTQEAQEIAYGHAADRLGKYFVSN
jgi:phosphoglycerate dehydrogenase-like enzyme